MELKIFRKIINEAIESKGFSKKRSSYYLYVNDILIIVGLQKSSYANGYYINIGYLISKLNPSVQKPNYYNGDVRARFTLDVENKKSDFFDLDSLEDEDIGKLKESIDANINKYVTPVLSLGDLKNLIEKNPTMLYQTSISAKELLGFE
jgi:Domain of unknown function (DUF4304)